MENKIELSEHLEKLGRRAKDKVTGAEGVITCISFDLFGCVQYLLKPQVKKDGTLQDASWFDSSRLVCYKVKRIMEPLADYYYLPCTIKKGSSKVRGPEDKPIM